MWPDENINFPILTDGEDYWDDIDYIDTFRDLFQKYILDNFKKVADKVDSINPDSEDNSELMFSPEYSLICDCVSVIAIQDCPLNYYFNNRSDKACFTYHLEVNSENAVYSNQNFLGTLEGFPSIPSEAGAMLDNFQNFYTRLQPWTDRFEMLEFQGKKDVLSDAVLYPYQQYTSDRFFSILAKDGDVTYSNWLDSVYNRYSWTGWQSGSYYFNPLDKAFLNVTFNNVVTYNENTGNYSITGSNDGWLPMNAGGTTFYACVASNAPVITCNSDTVINNTITNYHNTIINNTNNTYNYTTSNGDTITVKYGDNYISYDAGDNTINYNDLRDALTDAVNNISVSLNFDTPLYIPEYKEVSSNYVDYGDFYIEPIHQFDKLPSAPAFDGTIDLDVYPSFFGSSVSSLLNFVPNAISGLLTATFVLVILVNRIKR